MSNKIVGTKQAAELLGVSISTVYRMIEQGLLQPTKTPGGQRRFDVTQLEDFKESSKGIIAPQNPYLNKTESSSNSSMVREYYQESLFDNTLEEEHKPSPESENKPVDPRNMLNDLNGSQWLPETKSFFFQKGLGSKHPHARLNGSILHHTLFKMSRT